MFYLILFSHHKQLLKMEKINNKLFYADGPYRVMNINYSQNLYGILLQMLFHVKKP